MKRMFVSPFHIISVLLILIIIASPVHAEQNKTIICGVILPLSGDFESLGTEVLHGIECAVEEINTDGGAEGYTINLVRADDKSDPDVASSLFADMKEEQIPVVIGSLTTALTLPMAEQTKSDQGTILISPRANGNNLYGISPGFYQVHAPVFHLGKVVADWLSYTSDRSALIYIDDSYGRSFCDTIREDLKNSSTTTVSVEVPMPHDDPGFSQTIAKILDSVSDTVVIIGCDSNSASLLKALNDAGFDGQVVLTESCLMNSLESDTTNNTPAQFSLFTANAYTTLVPGKGSERFVYDYQRKYGKSPEGSVAGYGYDAMMMIAEAVKQEKQTEPVTASGLMKGLQSLRYYGVTGPKIIDDKNAVSPAYDRYIFRNGKFEILSTSIR